MIISIILLQIMLYVFSRNFFKNDFHPAALFSLFWLAVLCATALGGSDYYFSGHAYLSIFFFQLALFFGGILCSPAPKKNTKPKKNTLTSLPLSRAISWSSVFFGAITIFFTLKAGGYALTSLMSTGITDVSRELSVARYTEQFRLPFLASISQMLVFFSCGITGCQLALSPFTMRRFEYFLPILSLTAIAVILTTRATVLFGSIIFGSMYISGKIYSGSFRKESLLTVRTISLSLLLALAIAFMFISLQFMRGGITDLSRLPEILDHLRKWPFGSIGGYSIWYDEQGISTDLNFGYYTFTGVFDQLGIRSRETGLYVDYVDLGGGSWGNIYTVFRGIIEDFGYVGAYLFFILIGVTSARAYRLVCLGNLESTVALASIYSFILWSPVVSFFSYTGHIVAFVGLWLYLKLSRSKVF